MKQERVVYLYMKAYYNKHTLTPTYQEFCNACNIKSKSHVFKIVDNLVNNNYLKKIEGIHTKRRLKFTRKKYRVII